MNFMQLWRRRAGNNGTASGGNVTTEVCQMEQNVAAISYPHKHREIRSLNRFSQQHPSTFNQTTTIRYDLSTRSILRLRVSNMLGQVVIDLVNADPAAGWSRVVWNANESSGLYFYRLEVVSLGNPTKKFVDMKKMLLLH